MALQQVLKTGQSSRMELPYGSVILFAGRGSLTYGRVHCATQRTLLVESQTLGPFRYDMMFEIAATAASTYQVLDLSAITVDDLALVAGVPFGTRAWLLDGDDYSEVWFDGTEWKASGFDDAPSDGSTYGRRNGAWSVIGAGGITNWGDIGGDIDEQTDLVDALALKADSADLGTAASHSATDFATAAQGTKADSAVQPGSLAAVATSGAYGDLSGKPTLGSSSTHAASDFATAAQGATADSATQPGDLATVATTGAYADLSGKPSLAFIPTSAEITAIAVVSSLPGTPGATTMYLVTA